MVLPTPISAPSRTVDATVMLEVSGVRKCFRLLNPTRIGSADDCQIRLGGPEIQPHHAIITEQAGAWRIDVTDPAFPMSLNRVKTSSARLREGDVLTIAGVAIEFHLGPFAPVVDRPNNTLPRDPVEPKRALLVELAQRQTQLDHDRALLTAEHESWLVRLAAEKKLIEDRQQKDQQRIGRAEQAFRERRIRAEAELRHDRQELESRIRSVREGERGLEAAKAEFERERSAWLSHRHEVEKRQQAEWDSSRRAQQAASRLLQQLQHERTELQRHQSALNERETLLGQSLARIENQIEVRSQELAGLNQRVDNERQLLAELESRRTTLEVAATDWSLPMNSFPIPSSLATNQLENLVQTIEGLSTQLEQAVTAAEESDRRRKEERLRIAHLRRHLIQRQRELDSFEESVWSPRLVALESREKELVIREAEFDRLQRTVESKRAQLLLEQARWNETKSTELSLLQREKNKLRANRVRVALSHRRRMSKLRQARNDVHTQQRRVLARIGEMIRREGVLEILSQEIGHQRLLTLEEEARRIDSTDLASPTASDARHRALERRQFCEERWLTFERRMNRSMEWIEAEIAAGKQLSISSAPPRGELERLQSSLAELHLKMERQQNAWTDERRRYQDDIRTLQGEIESLAASFLLPNGAKAA